MAVKQHILVVDDEESVEILFQQYFRKERKKKELVLHYANSGKKAIKVLEQHPDISVILTDITMPGMDGLQLLAHVKEHWPLVPVVMMTAYPDEDMMKTRTAMNSGAFDYLEKPLQMETVTAAIVAAEKEKRVRQADSERMKLEWYQRSGHQTINHVSAMKWKAQLGEKVINQFLSTKVGQESVTVPSKFLIEQKELLMSLAELATISIRPLQQVALMDRQQLPNIKLRTSDIDLVFILQKTVMHLENFATAKGLELRLETPENCTIQADEIWIAELFHNLVQNAVKFTEEGQVVITLSEESSFVVVTIRDSGPGIPEDKIEFIFDHGAQAGDKEQNSQGTGIGLSLVKNVLDLHGGLIRVDSKLAIGSTFTVMLPKQQPEQEEV